MVTNELKHQRYGMIVGGVCTLLISFYPFRQICKGICNSENQAKTQAYEEEMNICKETLLGAGRIQRPVQYASATDSILIEGLCRMNLEKTNGLKQALNEFVEISKDLPTEGKYFQRLERE